MAMDPPNASEAILAILRQVRAAVAVRGYAREVAMSPANYRAFRDAVPAGRIDGIPVVMDPDLVSFVVR